MQKLFKKKVKTLDMKSPISSSQQVEMITALHVERCHWRYFIKRLSLSYIADNSEIPNKPGLSDTVRVGQLPSLFPLLIRLREAPPSPRKSEVCRYNRKRKRQKRKMIVDTWGKLKTQGTKCGPPISQGSDQEVSTT